MEGATKIGTVRARSRRTLGQSIESGPGINRRHRRSNGDFHSVEDKSEKCNGVNKSATMPLSITVALLGDV